MKTAEQLRPVPSVDESRLVGKHACQLPQHVASASAPAGNGHQRRLQAMPAGHPAAAEGVQVISHYLQAPFDETLAVADVLPAVQCFFLSADFFRRYAALRQPHCPGTPFAATVTGAAVA